MAWNSNKEMGGAVTKLIEGMVHPFLFDLDYFEALLEHGFGFDEVLKKRTHYTEAENVADTGRVSILSLVRFS